MFVIKAGGSKERFQKSKIANTCMRAGVNREDAEDIAEKISRRIKSGTATREIYKIILSELGKIEKRHRMIFRLRESVSELPSKLFETYAKKVLQAHGYECVGSTLIKGRCVEHEVDVIAKRDKLYLVECKHHINPHRFCGLGIALQVQARLEDIVDGFKAGANKYNFDNAWIFNNTKFSDHAKMYAAAKGIRMTGWRNGDYSLDSLIHEKNIFPITILSINPSEEERMFDMGIATLQDIIENERAITRKLGKGSEKFVEQARKLIS